MAISLGREDPHDWPLVSRRYASARKPILPLEGRCRKFLGYCLRPRQLRSLRVPVSYCVYLRRREEFRAHWAVLHGEPNAMKSSGKAFIEWQPSVANSRQTPKCSHIAPEMWAGKCSWSKALLNCGYVLSSLTPYPLSSQVLGGTTQYIHLLLTGMRPRYPKTACAKSTAHNEPSSHNESRASMRLQVMPIGPTLVVTALATKVRLDMCASCQLQSQPWVEGSGFPVFLYRNLRV